ncbi:helix-hairpin-helix domain-containing protein [Sneathia vaginalis]|uniref:helix-hairpin-helix domain-containing protein n=1 Tax=Sneathia vaginalis TaxID=187101 RepID=UPI00372CFFFD
MSDTVVLRLFEKKLMTLEDFKNVTEKEVLTLDGIGPVTIKKLKDNGIKFKED